MPRPWEMTTRRWIVEEVDECKNCVSRHCETKRRNEERATSSLATSLGKGHLREKSLSAMSLKTYTLLLLLLLGQQQLLLLQFRFDVMQSRNRSQQ